MKYLLLVYNDDALLGGLEQDEFDARMRTCLGHADEMTASGTLVDYRMLETPAHAKTVRKRNAKVSVLDGPFAETKEYLGGFNLIEADSMEEAVRIASTAYPWIETGSIEVRPLADVDAVRRRVGAPAAT